MTNAIALLSSLLILAVSVLLKVHSPEWKDLFFYNGDSVTLALALQSINQGEPFRWVFSSQNFLFPESILYIVSYWATGDYRNALALNGVINLFLTVLFFWSICVNVHKNKPHDGLAVSLVPLFFSIILFMEQRPDINGKSLFTLALFNTYYFGVIISSVLMVALFLNGVQKIRFNNLFHYIFVVVGSLCYASDPLYLIQFAAPFIIVVALVSIPCWRASLRFCFSSIILVAISLIFGQILRIFLKDYTVASVNSYVKFDQIVLSVNSFFGLLSSLASAPLYLALWVFWALSMVCVGYAFIRAVTKFNMLDDDKRRAIFLGFCFIAPLVNIAGVILSGNYFTRYFVTMSFFPTLGLSFIVAENIRGQWLYYLFILVSAGLVLPAYAKSKNALPIMSSYEKSLSCYQHIVKEEQFHAVGSYWTSRYLDLYRVSQFRTFQILNDFKPYNWLSNRYDYADYKINAVVVDNQPNPAHINPKDVENLGAPTRKKGCENFDIYIYDEGTYGYHQLNTSIRSQ